MGTILNIYQKKINMLINLKELYLSGNKIHEIPVEVAGLNNLIMLWLDFMEIKYFPKEICSMPLLEDVYFRKLPKNIDLEGIYSMSLQYIKNVTYNTILIHRYSFQCNI